jgi:hypothetical protein
VKESSLTILGGLLWMNSSIPLDHHASLEFSQLYIVHPTILNRVVEFHTRLAPHETRLLMPVQTL